MGKRNHPPVAAHQVVVAETALLELVGFHRLDLASGRGLELALLILNGNAALEESRRVLAVAHPIAQEPEDDETSKQEEKRRRDQRGSISARPRSAAGVFHHAEKGDTQATEYAQDNRPAQEETIVPKFGTKAIRGLEFPQVGNGLEGRVHGFVLLENE